MKMFVNGPYLSLHHSLNLSSIVESLTHFWRKSGTCRPTDDTHFIDFNPKDSLQNLVTGFRGCLLHTPATAC
jgi:hypothetical protein